ncbi:hypothetical protein ASPNIDRAFT_39238 [Aspergillus niger ATCC 1015]|uniref:Uncharacterized protein n=2 Tax=Aspergillus niger TaxID=5061 RepID=G3YAU4_ASPNA|nr:hypothetical protein ASPNIDRAFT_39238 [Aspergillus niger ATCC 1015]TPR04789.1 hypothetical protein CAN33_0031490 [Aspergillus niger]
MSTVNMVKYYFYRGMLPADQDRLRQLLALAYQTARDRKLYPKAVLIRSEVHDTTSINGVRQKDPLGPHVTLCYKDETQILRGTHIASHGYVHGKDDLEFVRATHAGEKPDSAKRQQGRKTVWPSDEELVTAPEIGYGHFPEN